MFLKQIDKFQIKSKKTNEVIAAFDLKLGKEPKCVYDSAEYNGPEIITYEESYKLDASRYLFLTKGGIDNEYIDEQLEEVQVPSLIDTNNP